MPFLIGHAYYPIGDPFACGGRATLTDDGGKILQRIFDLRHSVSGGLIRHSNLLLGYVEPLGHCTTLRDANLGQLFHAAAHLGDGLPRTAFEHLSHFENPLLHTAGVVPKGSGRFLDDGVQLAARRITRRMASASKPASVGWPAQGPKHSMDPPANDVYNAIRSA